MRWDIICFRCCRFIRYDLRCRIGVRCLSVHSVSVRPTDDHSYPKTGRRGIRTDALNEELDRLMEGYISCCSWFWVGNAFVDILKFYCTRLWSIIYAGLRERTKYCDFLFEVPQINCIAVRLQNSSTCNYGNRWGKYVIGKRNQSL